MRAVKQLLVGVFLMLMAAVAHAKDAYISMMYSNAIDHALPFDLVSKGTWTATPDARFVKLHLYFDEPIPISAVEVDACDTLANRRFSLWLNFDEWAFRQQGIEPEEDYPTPRESGSSGKTFYARAFPAGSKARSLTWNFEDWRGVSLCGLRVYDADGSPYTLHVPAIVPGTARASSTLNPENAYDVMNLFDSRFEYAWASNGRARDVDLDFTFEQEQTVEKIRIWNGYQRSPAHCAANSRAREFKVTGDGGYTAVLHVADQMGSQVLALPTPFSGRKLRIHVTDAFAGRAYQDLVISELRFGAGSRWFALDAQPMIHAASEANRTHFEAAGLGGVLNQSFVSEVPDEDRYAAVLRLRADGSFYLSGTGVPGARGKDAELRAYFTLGNYEIVKLAHPGGLRLRLFGLYYDEEAYGDCNGCGRDCNRKEANSKGRIFEEYVSLKPESSAEQGVRFSMDNESGGKKLPFKKLRFEPEKQF